MSKTTGQFAQKTETKRKNPFSCKPDKDFSESASSPFAQVLHLQRTIGNKAVTRLIQSGAIQAKLKIGPPNDIYEKEADRVADRVMQIPEPKGSLVNSQKSLVQRESNCPECMEEAEQVTPLVQRETMDVDENEDELKPKLIDNNQLQRQEDVPEEEEEGLLSVQKQEDEEELIAKMDAGNTPEVTPTIESNINAMKGGGQPLTESTRNFFEPRFGVNFSQVRVHNDSCAAQTAQAINAKAFTTGKDIVFNSGQNNGDGAYKRINF